MVSAGRRLVRCQLHGTLRCSARRAPLAATHKVRFVMYEDRVVGYGNEGKVVFYENAGLTAAQYGIMYEWERRTVAEERLRSLVAAIKVRILGLPPRFAHAKLAQRLRRI